MTASVPGVRQPEHLAVARASKGGPAARRRYTSLRRQLAASPGGNPGGERGADSSPGLGGGLRSETRDEEGHHAIGQDRGSAQEDLPSLARRRVRGDPAHHRRCVSVWRIQYCTGTLLYLSNGSQVPRVFLDPAHHRRCVSVWHILYSTVLVQLCTLVSETKSRVFAGVLYRSEVCHRQTFVPCSTVLFCALL